MPRAQLGTATRASSDARCPQSSATATITTTPSNALASPLDRSRGAWTSPMAAHEVGANILPPSLRGTSAPAKGVAWTLGFNLDRAERTHCLPPATQGRGRQVLRSSWA